MKVYLVGGAVRDALLGRPVRERDWVVVGSTPQAMEAQGYRQVGRDFPVFLHPQSGEEYALARTERKTGPGHTGFVCHAGPDVTLEDDLRRRDLTVNAMAEDADGHLVDPFGGRGDLAARVLRHVSQAFVEDPLRVFRVARFAAQLPDFAVADETLALMRRMARDGELTELAAERVWQELHKALDGAAPRRFFEVLGQTQALSPWLAELADGVPAIPVALQSPELRFGALCRPLGQDDVTALCQRLKAPRRFQQLGEHVAGHGATLAGWQHSEPRTLLHTLEVVGALARQRDPEPALRVVEACDQRSLEPLRELVGELAAITAEPFRRQGISGKEIGEAMRDARLARIAAAQRERSP